MGGSGSIDYLYCPGEILGDQDLQRLMDNMRFRWDEPTRKHMFTAQPWFRAAKRGTGT
jgi:hypothetical protein